MQGTTVDADLGPRWIDFGAELGDDVAVDHDPALPDHRLGGTSGGATPRRHHTLQSFHGQVSGGHAAPRTGERLDLEEGSLGDLPVADEEYHAADLVIGAPLRSQPQRELDRISAGRNRDIRSVLAQGHPPGGHRVG